MSFTLLFFIFSGILGIGMTCYLYWEERQVNEPLPEHPIMPGTQMTPDEVDELLSHYGIIGETFDIPQEHLPLHESFAQLAAKYSKISFSPYSDAFDRALMKAPYSGNPLYVPIIERDGDVY